MPPRTCVIGAGISGLTTGKSLRDHGVEYRCFESSDRIGGNWAFGNPNGHSSAYRSLHIDTSKDLVAFRDFPIDESYPDFLHHTEIKQYLDSYAERFGLLENIDFETRVDHARRRPGGGWEIDTADGQTHEFDSLVVGNGHHWDPRLPDFPGEFSGQTIHSHHYVSPTEPLDLRGKRILVVGIGNSAADITSELSQQSLGNQVVLSTRSGAWVVPKYLFGKPVDRVASTLPYIPLRWQRRLIRGLPRLVSGRPEDYGLPTPNHNFMEAHPTLSSELLLRLGSGDARAKPNVARLDDRTVHFEDGSAEEFDAIIYATGYNITFPFFDADFLSAPDNHLPLYKRVFKPGVENLCFVGFAQALPTLFPFVEWQARLVGRYLSGRYRLPSPAQMEKTIARDEKIHIGHYNRSARHTQQIEFFTYERDLRDKEMPAGAKRAGRRA